MGERVSDRSALLSGAAIDGAVAGFAAALLMTLFELLFWYRFGIRGVVQWQVNEIMVSKILSKPYVQGKQLPWAIGMHLFHGTALGALYAVVIDVALSTWNSSPFLAGLGGLVYTVALWLFVPFALRNKLQRAGRVIFTDRGMGVSLLAHLIYGLSLGEFLFILHG